MPSSGATINRLAWMIGGEAGYGIMVSGKAFSLACKRAGLWVFDYTEYPSLIRGGHNSYHVRVEPEPVMSQVHWVDLLVALDRVTVDQHFQEVSPNGGMIYESEKVPLDPPLPRADIKLYPVPMIELAKQAGGDELMKNTVALGASAALVGLDLSIFNQLIQEAFAKKGEVVAINQKALQLGFEYMKQHFPDDFGWKLSLQTPHEDRRLLVTGNEMLVAGALRAGCNFLAAYPMTPINAILGLMTLYDQEYKIVVKQPEDEIAGINMAIGASFAGCRAMTCTSGGGFSLMVEGLGLAAETETPLVIVLGQRPGPATGMPTFTEQGDLRFAMHAHQGDLPRIVLAPGDAQDVFGLIGQAFHLADKYQLLVIVLTDKFFAESHWTIPMPDQGMIKVERPSFAKPSLATEGQGKFARFAFTETGVSPRVLPGTPGGESMVTSDEHSETGLYNETAIMRKKMMEKRFAKLAVARKELAEPRVVGPENADITIIGWGSTKGPILEALALCRDAGINVNYQQLMCLLPLSTDIVNMRFGAAKQTVVIENNYSGQLDGLITQETQHRANFRLLKYDGRPFYPLEIFEYLSDIAAGKAESKRTVLTRWHDHVDTSRGASISIASGTAVGRKAMEKQGESHA